MQADALRATSSLECAPPIRIAFGCHSHFRWARTLHVTVVAPSTPRLCMRTTRAVLLIVAMSTIAFTPATAQELASKSASYSFGFENDMIAMHLDPAPPDYDYTSGLRV